MNNYFSSNTMKYQSEQINEYPQKLHIDSFICFSQISSQIHISVQLDTSEIKLNMITSFNLFILFITVFLSHVYLFKPHILENENRLFASYFCMKI